MLLNENFPIRESWIVSSSCRNIHTCTHEFEGEVDIVNIRLDHPVACERWYISLLSSKMSINEYLRCSSRSNHSQLQTSARGDADLRRFTGLYEDTPSIFTTFSRHYSFHVMLVHYSLSSQLLLLCFCSLHALSLSCRFLTISSVYTCLLCPNLFGTSKYLNR